jgi:hypothetical protein
MIQASNSAEARPRFVSHLDEGSIEGSRMLRRSGGGLDGRVPKAEEGIVDFRENPGIPPHLHGYL